MSMYIASFDIGKNNFAFVVEEFDAKALEELIPLNPPADCRYAENNTTTDEMQEVLDQVYNNGRIILFKNLDLTANCDSKKRLDSETFHNMVEVLDTYQEIWEKCSIVIIEEQMQFKTKLNMMAVKLGQHCYSYFVFRYGREKRIIEFPATNKTQILGAERRYVKTTKKGKKQFKALNPRERKNWCVSLALEIMNNRGEEDVYKGILRHKKQNDICDTICQLQAAKYLIFVNKNL